MTPTASELASWYEPLHRAWPETRPDGLYYCSGNGYAGWLIGREAIGGTNPGDAHAAAILADAAIEAMAKVCDFIGMGCSLVDTNTWEVWYELPNNDRASAFAPTRAEAVARAAMQLREPARG